MIKVAFFGTHPQQYNGYSKVVYNLSKLLCNKDDIDLRIFGFQNFYGSKTHRSDLSNIVIYDAFEHEEPKTNGFNIQKVKEFTIEFNPDVCIVFNDMLIIMNVLKELNQIENRTFKIISYIDQVYLNQKKMFIDMVNNNSDAAMLFTPFWEKNIVEQGVTIPTFNLPHGFDKHEYYPIPKEIARDYYSLKKDDFIILNLNKNQPRKRWDTCLKAFAEIVYRYPDEPIKLLIATALHGAWDLLEIFERELKKRGKTLADGMKHLIVIDNPQKLSDFDVNILYNIADLGINTCDGEGFGLCNFEQAAIGVPQIVPKLGGFTAFFDETCVQFVEPKIAYYVDKSRDLVCGEALMCDYIDFVYAFEEYYRNRNAIVEHGNKCRTNILANFSWDVIVDKLHSIIHTVVDKPVPAAPESIVQVLDIDNVFESTTETKVVIEKKKKKKNKPSSTSKAVNEALPLEKDELLKMKKRIEELLKAC